MIPDFGHAVVGVVGAPSSPGPGPLAATLYKKKKVQEPDDDAREMIPGIPGILALLSDNSAHVRSIATKYIAEERNLSDVDVFKFARAWRLV
jgi:hypothetical protein